MFNNMNFNKRKVIILSLVFVLISISYLNYMINRHSLLETSTELEEFEENQMAIMDSESKDNVIVHESNLDKENDTSSIALLPDETKIVDSMENNLDDIISASNNNIEETIKKDDLSESKYFLQAKIDIEVEREKTLERFDEIINNEMVDEESRKDVVSKKMNLIDTINKEKIVESLIKGKGFEDSVVFITEESVYVTVLTEELLQPDIAKILDIVTRETKVAIDNIKIQKK